jgi:small-conductance mechanosensitive channel
MDPQQVRSYELFRFGSFHITVENIVATIVTISVTILVLWILKKVLFRKKNMSKLKEGNLFSLYQVIKYIAWIIAILSILDSFGVKLNVLLASSAALLVGMGFGLQTVFNDFVSGIILLFEGSTKVGDILEVDGDVIKIKRIGLRTSEGINRDDIIVILPNSKITSNKVINWSHQSKKTRFRIKVGVAYGSDVDLVIKLLIESALEQEHITDKESVIARFIDFGNSSLDFELLFYSTNIFRIENVKSDIRRTINQKFTENGITIPFPQMDVYLKTKD